MRIIRTHLLRWLMVLVVATYAAAVPNCGATNENRIVALDAVPASPILEGKPGVEFVLITRPLYVGALNYVMVIDDKSIEMPWMSSDLKGIIFAMPRAEFDKLRDGADVIVMYGNSLRMTGDKRNFGKLRKSSMVERKQSLIAVEKDSPEKGAGKMESAAILEKRALTPER